MVVEVSTKILVIGGIGYVGKFIVEASVKAGHPTFALVRESTLSNPLKSSIVQNFNTLGVNVILGDIYDHQSLVKIIKEVDVVISTVSFMQLFDQYKIIDAIKEAGNIKRFFPSEFGNDVDRTHIVNEGKVMFDNKVKIRRMIEAEGIPYTYVVANFLNRHFLSNLMGIASPSDPVIILGDGNIKSTFNTEESVAAFTIKTIDDPRTLNKTLFIRPHANTLSYNDLISLWEKKNSKTLKRIYVLEEPVLKLIQESPYPLNMGLSICLTTFVKGDHTNYEIEPSFGFEASELYPDVKYTTVEDYIQENHDCSPFYLNNLISIKNVQHFHT
ncbi:phenylcoumaran benzylic ether reductase POP1 [Cicer arietinum]|uniref:Isoflavone reductase homolog PCBER n=1 Tax=Cicer arietinum TaxID=3827 RepID=A0A1S2YNE5_CICAR|nr:isoflavone reductase homolog PCBER [Cicer arietinum]